MIGRLALLAAVIGAVVVAAQWSLQAGEDAEPAAAAAEPAPAPFLRAAVLEDFDAAGRLRLRVDAARIEFDPADESLGFEAIALDYFAGPSQTWRVNADRGHAPRGFAVLELSGNVVLSGIRDRKPREATVRTEQLSFDTAAEVVRSAVPVRVEFGRHTLEATGFVANMKRETLRLESRVNGQFFP
jgi:LPS export ABC transporter protein LptC